MESNAAEPLSIINEARSALAARLITPWWYHPLLGGMLAVYIVAYGLGNTVVKIAAAMVFVACCLGLARLYRRLTGVWVSGFEAGRASRWAYALGALVGIALIAAWVISYVTSLVWPAFVLAAVGWAATIALGHRFDVALRAQLRAGA